MVASKDKYGTSRKENRKRNDLQKPIGQTGT
jgi:hypothetical protein